MENKFENKILQQPISHKIDVIPEVNLSFRKVNASQDERKNLNKTQ